jgi:hypothetical protein
LSSITDRILPADDEQDRLAHPWDVLTGEVGTATAGDDRAHGGEPHRRGDKRGGHAGAGAKEPDAKAGGALLVAQPVGQRGQPCGEQADVEA